MPFTTDTLPAEVMALPSEAQTIWLSVFNSAFRTFSGPDEEKEEAAFAAAWSAINSRFAQNADGTWTSKALSFPGERVRSPISRVLKFTRELMEAKKRITYGEIYVPWDVDSQGDFADESVIEEGAHEFLKLFRTIGEQHADFNGKGVPVESFIARKGDRDFKVPGTWVAGVQWSPTMWEKILNGEITGYSWGGESEKIPIVAGAEYAMKGAILQRTAKSAELVAEIDDSLFEKPEHRGPRVISQLVKMVAKEVSGVDLGANRRRFTAYKTGGSIPMRVRIVGEERKAQVFSMQECVPMAEQLFGAGNGLQACSLLQAKYPAGPDGGIAIPDGQAFEEIAQACVATATEAGILNLRPSEGPAQLSMMKSLSGIVKQIAEKLGISATSTEEGSEGEDEPMNAQDRKELDDRFATLRAEMTDSMKTIVNEAITSAVTKATTTPAAPAATVPAVVPMAPDAAAPAATSAPVVEEDGNAPVKSYDQVESALLEIAGRVLKLEETLTGAGSSKAATSSVGTTLSTPTPRVNTSKSMGAFSTIAGIELPPGAREAVAQKKIDIEKRRHEKRSRILSVPGA